MPTTITLKSPTHITSRSAFFFLLFSVSSLRSYINHSHRYTSNISNLKRHPSEDFLTPACVCSRYVHIYWRMCEALESNTQPYCRTPLGRDLCVRRGSALTHPSFVYQITRISCNWNLFLILFGIRE